METDLSATAQQTPANKTRSNSDYSQVDNYLVALKCLGIPTSDTDNLDAPGLPQNTVKIIFNTTLGRLRIYNPIAEIWTDATVGDLANYLPLEGGVLTGTLTGTTINAEILNSDDGTNSALVAPTIIRMKTGANEVYLNSDKITFQQSGPAANTISQERLTAHRTQRFPDADGVFLTDQTGLSLMGGTLSGDLNIPTASINASFGSIGQGDARTAFISDPNGYTGFAFYDPSYEPIQLRFQPGAFGKGLHIYDPQNPLNTGIGNSDWKRILTDGDALPITGGTLNGLLKVQSGSTFMELQPQFIQSSEGSFIQNSGGIALAATTGQNIQMNIGGDTALIATPSGVNISGNTNVAGHLSTNQLNLNEGVNNLGLKKKTDEILTINGGIEVKSIEGSAIASLGEGYNTFNGAIITTDNPSYPGYNYFETQDLSTGNRASLKTSGIGFNRADGYLNLIPESSITGGHNVTFPTPVTNATVAYTSDLSDYLPLAGGGTITNGSGNSTTVDGLRLSFSTGAFLQHANGQRVFFGDSEGEFLGIQRNRLSLTGPGYLGSKSVSIGANLLTDNRDCELPNESGTLLTEKSGVILTPNDYSPQTGKIHIDGTIRSNGIGGYYGGNSNYQLGVNGEGLYITQNTGQSYFGGSSLLFQDSNNPNVFTGFDAGRIFFRNTAGDTHYISNVRPYQGALSTGVDIELPGTSGRLLTEQLAASTYTLLINTSSPAPGPTSTGLKGQIIAAGGYRYECIDTNTWVRSAIETTW